MILGFALISGVLIFALGRWLDSQLRLVEREQALASYERTATATFGLLTETVLSDADLNAGLPSTKIEVVNDAINNARLGGDTKLRVRLISAAGQVAFSTAANEVDSRVPANSWLLADSEHARTRYTTADQIGLTPGTPAFQFSLPLRFGGGPAWGVVEVAGERTSLDVLDRHTVGLRRGLLLGLIALWLAMFPVTWWLSLRLKRQADENERLAQHDALTGLPNRTLLGSRLTEALVEGERRNGVTGLMLVDLDDFKDVNDTLGHQAGDVLLQHVAHRIAGAVRPGDTVSRLGGDEFAVVVANAQHPSIIGGVADRLLDALERPVQIGEVAITPGASIGIAMAPQHGLTVDQLMQRADIAMYAAKAGGLGRRTYSADIDVHSTSKLTMAAELRAALREDVTDQIDLVYQPIVNARTGEVVQFETLVRWKHPERGELLPKDFLPLAERSGLVAQLTDRTIAVALSQARTWLDAGMQVRIGVNLSSVVLQDQTLPSQIASALNRYRVPARLIEFEVTETSLMVDPESVLVLLRQLRALGATVALDDFGSGFSSLSHLRSLEADSLKIDRDFVEHLLTRAEDATIVASVIQLAHDLGMTVTAEGVETAEQAAKLVSFGCDRLQGYHLSYPLPPHAATALLRTRSLAPLPAPTPLAAPDASVH